MKLSNIIYILTPLILLATTFCSCQEQLIHQYHSVDSRKWHTTDTVHFQLPSLPFSGNHDFYVEARLDRQYAYSNLWLEVETISRDTLTQEVVHTKDTICITTADKHGKMLGHGKNLLEYNAPVRRPHTTQTSTLDIHIRHIISDRKIAGVHDIGIYLE